MNADLILERSGRDPLFGLSPAQFLEALKARLVSRVQEAYLFGSFGTAAFGPESDVDLILVKHTSKPFVERNIEFADLLELNPAMDVLVYTPEEFERLVSAPPCSFWRTVAETRRRLL